MWPVEGTFTCLRLTSMTRILLGWASLRPFASQFGRIGFVIAWYIISSLRNGGPYSSYPLFSFSLTFRTSSSWVAASAWKGTATIVYSIGVFIICCALSVRLLHSFSKFSLFLPFRVERALGIDPLIGVGSEIVALGLDEVGRQPDAAIGVEITQRHHQPRGRHP